MKFRYCILILLAVLTTTACGQNASAPKADNQADKAPASATATPAAQEDPNRVSILDGKISFVPPDGFKQMTDAEMNKKYPDQDNAPQLAYRNAEGDATIALRITNQPLEIAQLPALKGILSKHMEETVPGLKWIRKDMMSINGGSWLKMEAMSQDKKEKLYNDMYFTVFQGRMLGMNFNADVDRYPKLKAALEACRDSIQILP
jgi:hypothetical protein